MLTEFLFMFMMIIYYDEVFQIPMRGAERCKNRKYVQENHEIMKYENKERKDKMAKKQIKGRMRIDKWT